MKRLDIGSTGSWTEDICLAAVQQNGKALKYVEDKTLEICLAAVTQNNEALRFIKDPEMRKQVEEATEKQQASEMSVF